MVERLNSSRGIPFSAFEYPREDQDCILGSEIFITSKCSLEFSLIPHSEGLVVPIRPGLSFEGKKEDFTTDDKLYVLKTEIKFEGEGARNHFFYTDLVESFKKAYEVMAVSEENEYLGTPDVVANSAQIVGWLRPDAEEGLPKCPNPLLMTRSTAVKTRFYIERVIGSREGRVS